jgi:hypothetical protein
MPPVVTGPMAWICETPGIKEPIELRPFMPSHVGTDRISRNELIRIRRLSGIWLNEYIARVETITVQ